MRRRSSSAIAAIFAVASSSSSSTAAAAAASSSPPKDPPAGEGYGPYLPKSSLPGRDSGSWTSVDGGEGGAEFLSARSLLLHLDGGDGDLRLSPSLRRQLRRSSTLSDPYEAQPFVEGESEYDEYQQAWRYLGFVVDCDGGGGGDDDNNASGSWDGGTGEGCQRYLIWAAYVDLDYSGGGIGEYQYWDRDSREWDDTPCKYAENGSGRCARMDCHLDDTNFSLLGFFKHASHDDWMEQLFKHEGYCVWSAEEYAFMSSAREAWPQGCTYAGVDPNDEDGALSLYYDLKPTRNGFFTVGLYTDTQCVEDYEGQTSVEDVLGNLLVDGDGGSGSGDGDYDFSAVYETFDESLEAWDSAFDAWRICQPCLAHDLQNVGYGFDDDSMYGENYGANDDGGGGANFDCYDMADYTNVNQCMKFMAKTSMKSATFRDLTLANTQGTLVTYPTSRTAPEPDAPSAVGTTILFAFSSILVGLGGYKLYRVRAEVRRYYARRSLEEPLSGVLA